VSGTRKRHTIKTTTISDGRGRTLWAGAVRPGRIHDQTAVKTAGNTEGLADLLQQHPEVTARVATVDVGYRGRATAFRTRSAPRRLAPPLAKTAPAEQVAAYRQARERQLSERICVEHAIGEHKQWRFLQRLATLSRPPRRLRPDVSGDRRVGLRPAARR
jgi:hypothetical protein